VRVAEKTPADPEHHRAVTAQQGPKGRLVAVIDEPSKQVRIRAGLSPATVAGGMQPRGENVRPRESHQEYLLLDHPITQPPAIPGRPWLTLVTITCN
jgi:hypothetical protein